jgi:hypothetical protein
MKNDYLCLRTRVLRRIFGSTRDDLHDEELHNLYSSPSIIRMIKSRRMRWAGHVVRMGAKRKACRILVKARWKEPTGETKA